MVTAMRLMPPPRMASTARLSVPGSPNAPALVTMPRSPARPSGTPGSISRMSSIAVTPTRSHTARAVSPPVRTSPAACSIGAREVGTRRRFPVEHGILAARQRHARLLAHPRTGRDAERRPGPREQHLELRGGGLRADDDERRAARDGTRRRTATRLQPAEQRAGEPRRARPHRARRPATGRDARQVVVVLRVAHEHPGAVERTVAHVDHLARGLRAQRPEHVSDRLAVDQWLPADGRPALSREGRGPPPRCRPPRRRAPRRARRRRARAAASRASRTAAARRRPRRRAWPRRRPALHRCACRGRARARRPRRPCPGAAPRPH